MNIAELNNYFDDVYDQYKKFSGDVELMEKYRDIQAYRMYQMDFLSEERAIARQDGHAEGKLEGKIEIAKNLLKQGLSVEQISNATGLSKEEIVAISSS